MLHSFILPLMAYVLGIFSGYALRVLLEKGSKDLKRGKVDYSSFVLVAVTTVWIVSMIVDIASTQYETSSLVHGLMGAIVGFFYKGSQEKK